MPNTHYIQLGIAVLDSAGRESSSNRIEFNGICDEALIWCKHLDVLCLVRVDYVREAFRLVLSDEIHCWMTNCARLCRWYCPSSGEIYLRRRNCSVLHFHTKSTVESDYACARPFFLSVISRKNNLGSITVLSLLMSNTMTGNYIPVSMSNAELHK